MSPTPYRSLQHPTTYIIILSPCSLSVRKHDYSLLLFHQHVNERLCLYYSEAILWTANSRDGIRYLQWARLKSHSKHLPFVSRQGRPCLYKIKSLKTFCSPNRLTVTLLLTTYFLLLTTYFSVSRLFYLSNLSNLFTFQKSGEYRIRTPSCASSLQTLHGLRRARMTRFQFLSPQCGEYRIRTDDPLLAKQVL